MNKFILPTLLGCAAVLTVSAQPALTIYNQSFAVVRDTVPLDLKEGVNQVRFRDATAHVEPDSVILRDLAGKHNLRILEQNYRNDPVSQELLLSLFEGKSIDFEVVRLKGNTETREIVSGKVIRSGYVPGGNNEQPIIEVNGKLQFSLPGEPRFPSLGDDTVLKPVFNWQLQTDKPGKFTAEVGYVTSGFTWESSYNLVSPEQGDTVDFVGWVTMGNTSGKTFENAKIKLLAGDVNKIENFTRQRTTRIAALSAPMAKGFAEAEPVTEKTFDEFHIYTLARPTTLHDMETKQVEFVKATDVKAPAIYVYDGGSDYGFYGGVNENSDFGTGGNKKVRIYREIVNSDTNHLGIPLPKGKVRFYRRDSDGQLEFVGENTIDHTPNKETLRINTGNSFDLVGERKRTAYRSHLNPKDADDQSANLPENLRRSHWINETFQIKLRNRKKEPVNIRVVEHLYRWNNWAITSKSDEYKVKDSQTIEFNVPVQPDVEKVITYTVHYSW